MANTPWSGNYGARSVVGSSITLRSTVSITTSNPSAHPSVHHSPTVVSAPVWVSAHFGQFVTPGWRHLLVGRGSGILHDDAGDDVGSYVSFVPPGAGLEDVTLVVETMGASSSPRSVSFQLTGGLRAPTTLFVWQTTNSARFVPAPNVTVASDGTFVLSLPADGIVTASTIGTASHWQPKTPVPASAPFQLPYHDSFDETVYAYDAVPRYLSDQGGSFAVRNGSLVQTVTQRPGANDWYTTPDPITLLGDYTSWDDVRVLVNASLADAVGAPADPNAALAPCLANARGTSQVWTFDTPAPSYLSNTISGESICLNLYGCTKRLIYYRCCVGCGCSSDGGFRFTLDPNSHALTAPLLPGLCATAVNGSGVAMQACAPGASAQDWRYNATTSQLMNSATATCLTSSLQPQVPYVQACVRITGYTGFAGTAAVPGYCLRLDARGAWTLAAGNKTLSNGTMPAFDAAVPHSLEITALKSIVSAQVDGVALGAFGTAAFKSGMVALGSGVHPASFDDFIVENGQ